MLLAFVPGAGLGMPLRDAVRMGLSIHPEIRAADSDTDAAETDIKIAKGGYYPAVSVAAGPRNSSLDGVTYEVSATQMVYDWGRVRSRVAGARATAGQLSQDALVKRDAAALDIVQTYLTVLVTQRELEADKRHIARLQQVREMTEARSRGGYADRSEPERANLEYARAQDQLAADQGKLRDAQNQFQTLVGEPPTDLTEPAPQSMARYVERSDLSKLVSVSPLYLKAVQGTRYAEAQYREARSSLLPQLNVEATRLRRDIGGQIAEDSVIALRFHMNMFQGLSNFQQVSGARQRIESAKWKASAAERDMRRQVQMLFDTADMIERQRATLKTQVDGAASLSGLYQEQFAVGRRDVIDLLNIQRERYDAERQLIDTDIQLISIQYQAAAQLGLIGPLLEGGLTL